MVYKVVFSPVAQAHLLGIFNYLESFASVAVAETFTNQIISFCEKLEIFPNRGTMRDDLLAGLRIVSFRRKVTIAFLVSDDTVSILAIYYGGQDYEATFISNHENEL
jgi:toxin ParE1/3/4